MKICSKCKIKKPNTSFWKSKKNKDGDQGYCIECALAWRKIWKEERGGKKYHRDYMRKARRDLREKLIDLLGAKCMGCGIIDRRLLQIDHIKDGGATHRKKFTVAGYQYYKDMVKSIEKGENKYQLLCANCNYLKALNSHLKITSYEMK